MQKLKNNNFQDTNKLLANSVYHETYFVETTASVVVVVMVDVVVVLVAVVLPGQVTEHHLMVANSMDLKSDYEMGLKFLTFYFDLYYVALVLVGSFLMWVSSHEFGIGIVDL